MRILLTGCGGQVGRVNGYAVVAGTVIATDRSSLDLAFPEQVRAGVTAMRPDLIVNAAAYTDVERAESEEKAAVAINGVSVGELAVAACELQVPLIHYSTDYVFDGTKALPYVEDDQTAPLSAYGRSKLDGEQRIRSSGCAHLILRTSWIYAEGGRNFVTTMLRLAAERDELRVVDDQFGAPTFAGFIADATAHIIEQMIGSDAARRRVGGDTLHLRNGGATSWFGFASSSFASETIRQRLRPPHLIPIRPVSFQRVRAGRPTRASVPKRRAPSGSCKYRTGANRSLCA
jgi:dTDP-4-dehydrorhamnose reductase